jgi:hypothetical protein
VYENVVVVFNSTTSISYSLMIPLRSLANGGLHERKTVVALNACTSMLVGGVIGAADIAQNNLQILIAMIKQT